jgi:hypothetical protein
VGSTTTDYRIDALGQRIKKGGTYYHYAPSGQLIAESNAAGTIQREYVWLGATPIAVID